MTPNLFFVFELSSYFQLPPADHEERLAARLNELCVTVPPRTVRDPHARDAHTHDNITRYELLYFVPASHPPSSPVPSRDEAPQLSAARGATNQPTLRSAPDDHALTHARTLIAMPSAPPSAAYESIRTAVDDHACPSSASSLVPSRSSSSLLSAGSTFSSVVNVCSATLGIGALALPYAISQCGVIIGIALIMVAALSTVYSIHLLMSLAARTGCSSYEAVAYRAFGRPGEIVTQMTMLTFCFGGCVGCIMVVGDILHPVAMSLLPGVPLLHHRAMLQLLLVIGVMMPLSFYQHLSDLRLMSLTATIGVGILTLIIAGKGATALVAGESRLHHLHLWRLDSGILISIPIFLFGFICQTNLFAIRDEMRDRSVSGISRVVHTAVAIETALYLTIGLAGYLLYGSRVEGNVLENFAIDDPLGSAAQACIGVAIILTFPLNVHPARFTLQTMVLDEADTPSDTFTNATTAGLVLGALAVATFVPSLSALFSFLGATTGSLIAFILPATFHLAIGGTMDNDEDDAADEESDDASPLASIVKKQHAKNNAAFHRTCCWLLATGGGLLAGLTTWRSVVLFIYGPTDEAM